MNDQMRDRNAWTELGFAQRSPAREGSGTLPGFPGLIIDSRLNKCIVPR